MVRPLSIGAAFGPPSVLFRILRTRSARKNLVNGAVIVLLYLYISTICVASSGCKDEPPGRDPGAAPERARPAREGATGDRSLDQRRDLARLEAEAGVATESDPAPPSGDLKHDIASFESVEACARARGTTDPVVADAIDALGYDNLTRDACRLLEALKSRDKQLCKPISSSTLRARCESHIAVLIGDANLCPLNGLTKGEAHDPLCVARARRDERFCAAVISFRRSTCSAMVTGHADACRGDESCIRQVERWKSLLEAPSRHAPFSSHAHIEITPDKGTPDPPSRSFDLDDDAAAGAVVKIVGDRIHVTLGSPKTPYWPSSDAGYARPRIFVEVVTLPGNTKKSPTPLTPTDFTLDLLLPKVGTFSSLTSDQSTIDDPHWSSQVGEPLKFTIAIKLGDAPRYYAVKIAVETYVRDVIDAASNERRP